MKYLTSLFVFLLLAIQVFAEQAVEQVVIIGSGPAGYTAAIYTARAGLSTLLIEGESPGGQVKTAPIVENFPGFAEGISGFQLQENMRNQALRFGAQIDQDKVVEINLTEKPFWLKLGSGKVILSETVIVATGTSPKRLGIDAEKTLLGKGVASCHLCEGFLFRGKEVVVVGSGNNALEQALFLTKYASKVTVIPQGMRLKADRKLKMKVEENRKIHILQNSSVIDICDVNKDKVTGVIVRNEKMDESSFYPCAGVFIALGYLPNTQVFRDQLELDADGFVMTQPHTMCTNVRGVFAAGNVMNSRYQQAVTAAGTGCMAAIDACRFIEELDGQQDAQKDDL